MSQIVDAKIRFALQIQINTPTSAAQGFRPYRERSPRDQHAAKRRLLDQISDRTLLIFLGYWQGLRATVDDHYQEVVNGGSKAYVQSHLDLASYPLRTALQFDLKVGEPCPMQPCTKLPNCSHDCRHEFELLKVTTDDKGGRIEVPWVIEDVSSELPNGTGVKANVIAALEWRTPSMPAMPMDGGDDMSDDMSADASDGGGAT